MSSKTERMAKAIRTFGPSHMYLSSHDAVASLVVSVLGPKIRVELYDAEHGEFYADSGHCDTIDEAIEFMLRSFENDYDIGSITE